MANFCTNCGSALAENSQFCSNCGIKTDQNKTDLNEKSKETISSNQFNFIEIPKNIKVKNTQAAIVNKSLVVAAIAIILTYLVFSDGNPLSGIWAVGLIAIFAALAAVITAVIFKSRAKKMKSLISGESVLASWILDDTGKSQYVNYLYQNEIAKNKAIFWITTILIVIIFSLFIVFIDEGKEAMALVMITLVALIALFAFGMPKYYRSKNSAADGKILIGKKFAYINGFFHNWDFPLSGIKKAKVIQEPFYGLHIQYYYTDRTFTNTEELNIPAPKNIDLQRLSKQLLEN
jgi:hypothetical protein